MLKAKRAPQYVAAPTKVSSGAHPQDTDGGGGARVTPLGGAVSVGTATCPSSVLAEANLAGAAEPSPLTSGPLEGASLTGI